MGRGVGDKEGPKMAVSAEGALGVVGQGALCWAPSMHHLSSVGQSSSVCVVFLCK